MESRLLTIDSFKVKDLFNILSVVKSQKVIDHIIPMIQQLCLTMIPEEIVILNKLTAQHKLQGELSLCVEQYLTDNLDEMETLELSKVYMSCVKS